MEWHTLAPLDSASWDTPELSKARNACNAEIESILQERERVNTALQALASSDVANIDFDELEASRKRIERDRLAVLQRELKLRRDQMKPYSFASRAAASSAYDKLHSRIPEIEASIVKRLEAMGYFPYTGTPQAGGYWNPGMVSGHPERLKAANQMSEFRYGMSHHESDSLNQQAIDSLQATLSKALARVAA